MDDQLYYDWLAFAFGHPRGNKSRFERLCQDDEWTDGPVMVDLVARTFGHYMEDLDELTDEQLNEGLFYVFTDDPQFSIIRGPADTAARRAALESIKVLYRDCFARRCKPVLCRLDQGGTPLNHVCYMLWDASQLTYLMEHEEPCLAEALLDVLAYTLRLDNIACIESGLHGLGHICCHDKPAVTRIINDFLNVRRDSLPEPLVRYAYDAIQGYML